MTVADLAAVPPGNIVFVVTNAAGRLVYGGAASYLEFTLVEVARSSLHGTHVFWSDTKFESSSAANMAGRCLQAILAGACPPACAMAALASFGFVYSRLAGDSEACVLVDEGAE